MFPLSFTLFLFCLNTVSVVVDIRVFLPSEEAICSHYSLCSMTNNLQWLENRPSWIIHRIKHDTLMWSCHGFISFSPCPSRVFSYLCPRHITLSLLLITWRRQEEIEVSAGTHSEKHFTAATLLLDLFVFSKGWGSSLDFINSKETPKGVFRLKWILEVAWLYTNKREIRSRWPKSVWITLIQNTQRQEK